MHESIIELPVGLGQPTWPAWPVTVTGKVTRIESTGTGARDPRKITKIPVGDIERFDRLRTIHPLN